MVQTPAYITLPKSKHNVAVSCTAQCYSPGVSTLASHTEVMTAGNVAFGGLIGLGIDAASGAMNTYDPNVEVIMRPLPGAAGPRARPRECRWQARRRAREAKGASTRYRLPLKRRFS
jgi:hypothetical protein